ncbi:MAG TPA: hypothetical protein VFC63_27690 [Blastocatellia bacterium]|nr:hypothetical protein [Blastocatellia bacterium]
MSTWKGIYLTCLTLLAIALLVSFALATYNTISTIGQIRDQATSERLSRLPGVETFLGRPLSASSMEVKKKDEIDNMKWYDRYAFNLKNDLIFYGNSIPMSLLIATILMLLTILSAYFFRRTLVAVSESRRSFESLMMAIFGYGAFVLGFVFSWSNYTALAAQANTRPESATYTYEAGLAVVDQVTSSLSVGLIVAFFGVLIALFATFRAYRAYSGLNLREADYAYRNLPPFARHLR